MTVFNYEADAERVYDVLKQGGISVIPSHVGYVIVACDPEAIWRIFRAKKRKPEKLNAVCGCREMHLGLHDLPDDRRAIVTASACISWCESETPSSDARAARSCSASTGEQPAFAGRLRCCAATRLRDSRSAASAARCDTVR